MNGVQTRFKCKLDVKRCKRFVFPPSSLLPRSNALKTKAIRYFQTDRTLTRIVSPPLNVSASDASGSKEKGYFVDVEGNIDFPILGKLHVDGMSVSQVKSLIENQIKASNYIKDPLVTIDVLNFKYTVLGAVGRNGTFTCDGDRITLLEAIANAGDLTAKARINRVTVIREKGNERQMFVHDLRSKDIFDSPCFYLQQNDIVYVEPKYRKKDNEDRGFQVVTVLLSLVTTVCSLMWALK